MNERIRELALEAGLYYHPHGTCCMDEMFPFHFNPAEADKAYGRFAELIVRECISLIEPDKEHREDASWGYIGGEEGVELLDGSVRRIKEHFGVV
jgi:hypothetical protein